jgi:hypothetical protein
MRRIRAISAALSFFFFLDFDLVDFDLADLELAA